MTLIDRLLKLASLWAAAQGHKSTSRLATIVANDGELLSRLESGATCTVKTYERFLRFFREPSNWPEPGMPEEASDLLGEMEFIWTEPKASTGNGDEISGGPDWPIETASEAAE